MACGIADDMLSTTVLATKAPILLAPAMNTGMWTADATRANLKTLRDRGVQTVGPGSGMLACGDSGDGRMSEPDEIVAAIDRILNTKKDLSGLRVLVTAGATRERLDPVRFLTNDSSGKMGFALAEAARDRGAEVTVVRGSVSAAEPGGVRIVPVESALDLYDAMMRECGAQDIIIQAAAVADYRFAEIKGEKMKKQPGSGRLTLELVENPDVAKAVGDKKRPGQILIGFAAETNRVIEHASEKLKAKNLDMIVANDVTQPGAGFNVDTNIAALITREGTTDLPLQSKRSLAEAILDRAAALYSSAD
jgi:phosphopantothenoylcysteine decarboxylase/phosphopantothenate--cysteine ligase